MKKSNDKYAKSLGLNDLWSKLVKQAKILLVCIETAKNSSEYYVIKFNKKSFLELPADCVEAENAGRFFTYRERPGKNDVKLMDNGRKSICRYGEFISILKADELKAISEKYNNMGLGFEETQGKKLNREQDLKGFDIEFVVRRINGGNYTVKPQLKFFGYGKSANI